jgi:hypothetical protein
MSGQEHLGSLRGVSRRAALVAALSVLSGCGDATGPTGLFGPFTTNVALARAAWTSEQPASYVFEITAASEWITPGAYSGENNGQFDRVTVENGQVTDYRDYRGAPLNGNGPTIEALWQRILEAEQQGSLKSAKFAMNGVPVEWFIDRDSAADDALRYWIRSFTKR